MDFGLSSEQLLLKQSVRRFLDQKCPTSRVRAAMESATGHDPELWKGLAELGICGLAVPAEHGGSGLDLLDLALAAEELGYAAAPGPFLASSLASVALRESGDSEICRRVLPGIAEGHLLATVAIGEEESEWDPSRFRTRAQQGTLTGEKPLVPFAGIADVLLVAAVDDDGPGLWLVEQGAPGMETKTMQLVDLTRRVDAVNFRNTPAVRIGKGSDALDRTIDAGCILVAADAFGGASRCLEMTVSYAKTREQFGQIIGAFQAVKHQIANMACELEPSLALLWYAAHAFDHIREQSARHAALVKAHMTDVFDRIVRDSTELHGGIGFTWEFDLHLWFRRAVFDRCFLGEAALHRARAADLAGW
jgi:alkylation response protein AidB-like acyl-CoA dehydrogenase